MGVKRAVGYKLVRHLFVAFSLALLGGMPPLQGQLVEVLVQERADVLDGRSFGAAGAYEFLRGELVYEADPDSADAAEIPDLRLAEHSPQGKVVFQADFEMLRPKDPAKGSGTLLYDVVNRGSKTVAGTFNRGSGRSLQEARFYGDGFLLEQGYAILWSGWQYDVPDEDALIGLEAPVIREADGPIRGPVRAIFVPSQPASSFSVAHGGHRPIPVWLDAPQPPRLTVAESAHGARREIARDQWRITGDWRVEMQAGFEPGKIYELHYTAKDPHLAAAGYLAVRDLLSALKHPTEAAQPLAPEGGYERVYAYGNSQSAMFLRSFLYRGFNADREGRRVFDAVFSSVAGARSVRLKARFAQPSRTAGPFRAFDFPTDLFPHSDGPQTDPMTGEMGALLARAKKQGVVPKILHVNSAYEYFGCGASLIHAALDGSGDLPLDDNVRVFMFSSGQHGPGGFPPRTRGARHLQNPNDYRWPYRALLVALDRWVRGEGEPPASRYPRIADGTLVALQDLKLLAIPDFSSLTRIHQPRRLDFGPGFDAGGIVSRQPPRAMSEFAALVPQVDADGNDVAGVRMPEIAVPLATYTGWNLRATETGAGQELLDSAGSFVPFAVRAADREASKDPRPSVEERYPSREAYLAKYRSAAQSLIDSGLLLPRDLDAIMKRAEELWDWVVEKRDSSS